MELLALYGGRDTNGPWGHYMTDETWVDHIDGYIADRYEFQKPRRIRTCHIKSSADMIHSSYLIRFEDFSSQGILWLDSDTSHSFVSLRAHKLSIDKVDGEPSLPNLKHLVVSWGDFLWHLPSQAPNLRSLVCGSRLPNYLLDPLQFKHLVRLECLSINAPLPSTITDLKLSVLSDPLNAPGVRKLTIKCLYMSFVESRSLLSLKDYINLDNLRRLELGIDIDNPYKPMKNYNISAVNGTFERMVVDSLSPLPVRLNHLSFFYSGSLRDGQHKPSDLERSVMARLKELVPRH